MPTVRPAIMLFTRDLRLRDNPALDAAIRRGGAVVPLFVLENRLITGPLAAPNRVRFLLEALADLRSALRERGGELVLRRGDTVTEVIKLARETGAQSVSCADDVSGYAAARQRRLARACQEARLELVSCPGVTVVPAGAVAPSGGGSHFKVFTPYLRAWENAPRRALLPAPARVHVPSGLAVGRLPALSSLTGTPSPDHRMPGGEQAGQRRLRAWLRSGAEAYAEGHDDLAGDRTSRLSPYLHFGCVSPLQAAEAAGPGEFRRQLAWRDFYHQVTAAFPAITRQDYRPARTRQDYRPARQRWRDDSEALDAWRHGQTGVPIVDAGLRQLMREGWMHNRARMITASFLCKQLHIDWRLGARHFMDWLTDGDIPNNYGNWQWTAGTGNDTRPNRVLSPLRQSRRFDASGDYVRRYVSELADLDAPAIHQPWTLANGRRRQLTYPAPIIEV
jgi:deoxyribodipyrimidine photo-lyase